jgi:phosphoribosyl 1,2-cyclic phosphate phosphodiesterase
VSGKTRLLVDCGPDIASQLKRNLVQQIDAVLITHEHGDHFIGLDELFSFKRTKPRGGFSPIPVFMTDECRATVKPRFGYLEDMGVIKIHPVEHGMRYETGGFEFTPFKTYHGAFAKGSVGYVISSVDSKGKETRLVYTSDFVDIPEEIPELTEPDYLVIQSFWLNEPVENRPNHMSFQRALDFINRWKPKKETFLVHMGDGDKVVNDPANRMLKKYEPKDPIRPPGGGDPYPVPLNHGQWQETVNRILEDRHMTFKVIVARDDLRVSLG